MKANPLIAVAAILSITVAGGCGLVHHSNIVLNLHQWKSGPYQFTLGCNNRPQQLDQEAIAMGVDDAHGNPVTHCRVAVDLSMPSMPMPQNTTVLAEKKPGWYGGACRYTMAGAWQMTITVTHNGAIISSQTLPIDVR